MFMEVFPIRIISSIALIERFCSSILNVVEREVIGSLKISVSLAIIPRAFCARKRPVAAFFCLVSPWIRLAMRVKAFLICTQSYVRKRRVT